jgi:hypothetical protein
MLSASKFFLKRSYTPGSAPLSSDLGDGELAINLADKKIFFKDIEDQIYFLEISPYSFLSDLSSVLVVEGNNTVTGVFSQVLGGYNNDVSGGGSTVLNGENNDIEADFAFIANGLNNLILSGGDFGGIFAGQNNTLDHQNSFILGSNITSHLSGVTYVNNISATGKLYGDGSELTGIVAGDTEATTLVRNSSADWTSSYTTVQSNSSTWNSGGGGGTSGEYLPLSGGDLTGALTTTSTISSSQTISASGARVITGLPNDETPIYYMTVLPQSAYDALGDKNPNTIYFISNP